MGRQAWTVRLPLAIVVAASLGLIATWGQHDANRRDDVDFLLIIVSVACLDALMFGLLRLRYGWVIGIADNSKTSSHQLQFTILNLFLWTTLAALLVALANQVLTDWSRVTQFLISTRWLGAILGVFLLSLLTLPLVISATGLILADWPRRRFGTWFSVAVVLLSLAPSLLIFCAS